MSMRQLGANLVLSWLVPPTHFILQQCSDLTSANWVDVTNPPALDFTNLRYQVAVPKLSGNIFYRLTLQ